MTHFTGERRAAASTVLAFYGFLYLIVAMSAPPGWGPCFGALAGIYGLCFFSLVTGYFWARWFAIGVGVSGFISAALGIFQVGPEPVLVFYGGTHGFISLMMWGRKMATTYDGRKEWRERFHLDENATHRLGKAIIRAGVSLPYIVMYALAPKDGSSAFVLALVALGLAGGGTWALFHLRTWGLFALGLAGALALVSVGALSAATPMVATAGTVAGVLLILAAAPFAGPMLRALRK